MERKRDSKLEKIKVIQKLDLDILQGLYEYRAMSTDQLQRRYGMTNAYTYRKLRLLRMSGLISSHPIVRYRAGQRSQGKYHRITNEGLLVLRENGMYVDKRSHQLEVSESHVSFLLATNDLMVDLELYGWVLADSREIKARLGIHKTDNIHGTLQNVYTGSKEYGIYTYLYTVSNKNLEKMAREIKNYSSLKEGPTIISDYMIFKKGRDGFKDIVNVLMSENNIDLLPRVRSLKIFPYTFGKYYLRLFEEEDVLLQYACAVSENELSFKRRFELNEVNSKYSGLDCVVLHKGEEKYFVNLMDNDLKKIYHIQQYRKEEYEKDGRKVLAYVHQTMKSIHMELLQSYHHVEFLEVGNEILHYLQRVQPIGNE